MDTQLAPTADAGRPREPAGRRRGLWAALAVCLLLLGALTWWQQAGDDAEGGATVDEPSYPTAASVRGWGEPFDRDEFEGTELNRDLWRTYDGEGNAGVGLRRPSAVTVEDGALAIKARGDVSGGVAWATDYTTTYGRWEVRARMEAGSGYAPAILLWPDSDRWPEDGEIDIMEITAPDRSAMTVTVHYGADDKQETVKVPGSFTDWHTYAVEWAPDHVTVFLDGNEVFTTTTPGAVPTVPMHLAIQNDVGPLTNWIPARNAETPDVVGLYVDWVRMYEY